MIYFTKKIQKKISKAICLLSLVSFAACDKGATPEEVANRASNVGTCAAAETYIHDVIQKSFEDSGTIPSGHEVLDAYRELLAKNPNLNNLDENIKEDLLTAFSDLYSILEDEIDQSESTDETLKSLNKLEFGLHPDEDLQESYSNAISEYKRISLQTQKDCIPPVEKKEEKDDDKVIVTPLPTDPSEPKEPSKPEPPKEFSNFFEELKSETQNLSQFGALKSFAIAYQSCESVSLKALNSNDDDLEGVSIVGRHSSGRGNKREITNLSKVLKTHPYVKDFRKPASSCVDSKKSPFIYDFGGKPYATSSASSTLNFFKNAGSGSKALGVDCSGYVYTALMTAGLKLSPDKPLRARSVSSIPARAYMNPGSSMSCIEKVKAGTGTNLQGGDIFASTGHIFMIVHVGADPLGVQKALNNNSCSSITYKDFDFTLMQSSPSKGAIGMNHMDGTTYLSGSTSMRKGFEKFARLDCENKKDGKLRTPSISEAVLTRHKMTPECVTEQNLKLDNESCVERCSYEG
jgi:hypothetical protein